MAVANSVLNGGEGLPALLRVQTPEGPLQTWAILVALVPPHRSSRIQYFGTCLPPAQRMQAVVKQDCT